MITMQANKSTANGDTNRFEGEPGTYIFMLKEIVVDQGHEYDDHDKKFPQARFVWEDADGDTFSDSFVRVPLGFRLNDKAKWTNRLSALVGRPLTDEDAGKLLLDLGDDVSSYDDLCALVAETLDTGRGAFARVTELTFEGQSLFGKQAQLTLGMNAKGYNTCAAAGASPLPSAGGKKKKGAPWVGEDDAEPEVLLTEPPKKKGNSTEPIGY